MKMVPLKLNLRMIEMVDKVYDVTAVFKRYDVVTVKAKNKHEAVVKVIEGDFYASDVCPGDEGSAYLVESINDVVEVL